jgi:succinate dehydrogenase / fumarate reductase, cytochrome b subunit
MSSRIRVFATSVGTKLLIGVTGLALFLYLITHIAGNALIFLGPTTFNQYAHLLTSNPLIPVIEIGLVLIFLVHVYKTVTMYLGNQQARPTGYAAKKSRGGPSRRTFASATMIFSGLWLLIFAIIHVKAFKYGVEYETADGIRDLYRIEMENFRSPLAVGFYVLSMLVVGSHLWHGASSTFQSLGLDHPRWTPRIRALTKVLATLIAGGFIIIVLWAHLTQFFGQVGQ